MSETNGNASATYNIPLNNSTSDIFRLGCAHLYHFLQVNVNTDDCKPMMLKMHLELEDHPPSIEEAEERNTKHNSTIKGLRQSIQQHEEEIKALKDALLQAKEEAVNPNNGLRQSVQQHEEEIKSLKDALLQAKEEAVNPNNGLRQSVQQHEEEIKSLKDALLQAKEEAVNPNNGLRQSVQQHEEEIKALKDALLQVKENDAVNRIDKAPNVDNNAMQESNSNKEANNKNKLDGKHNDTENVASASASEGHHTNIMPETKPELIDLRRNCVYIHGFKCSDPSLSKAFSNIHELANEMNADIPNDSVIHIDVQRYTNNLDYYVYFCNADIKEEFLKNRHFYTYDPKTSPLRIFDYSDYGIVDIQNFKFSDWNLKTAYAKVFGIAEKMGLSIDSDDIDDIDMFYSLTNGYTYSVQFNTEVIRHEFLSRKDNLKQFPETKSLEIIDKGEHALTHCNLGNISMAVANAKVIGVAKLIGLPLASDNLKRIYVLNYFPYCCDGGFSLIVEFSSKQIRDEFLEKKFQLQHKRLLNGIKILDINARKNIVLIKCKHGHHIQA